MLTDLKCGNCVCVPCKPRAWAPTSLPALGITGLCLTAAALSLCLYGRRHGPQQCGALQQPGSLRVFLAVSLFAVDSGHAGVMQQQKCVTCR
jgi:hypothetical protein